MGSSPSPPAKTYKEWSSRRGIAPGKPGACQAGSAGPSKPTSSVGPSKRAPPPRGSVARDRPGQASSATGESAGSSPAGTRWPTTGTKVPGFVPATRTDQEAMRESRREAAKRPKESAAKTAADPAKRPPQSPPPKMPKGGIPPAKSGAIAATTSKTAASAPPPRPKPSMAPHLAKAKAASPQPKERPPWWSRVPWRWLGNTSTRRA